jgi:hypothetical protein
MERLAEGERERDDVVGRDKEFEEERENLRKRERI